MAPTRMARRLHDMALYLSVLSMRVPSFVVLYSFFFYILLLLLPRVSLAHTGVFWLLLKHGCPSDPLLFRLRTKAEAKRSECCRAAFCSFTDGQKRHLGARLRRVSLTYCARIFLSAFLSESRSVAIGAARARARPRSSLHAWLAISPRTMRQIGAPS